MPYTKGTTDSEVGNIGWTTELETGIDILDEQHRQYSVCRYATDGLFKGQKLASVDYMDAPLESGVGVHNCFKEHIQLFECLLLAGCSMSRL